MIPPGGAGRPAAGWIMPEGVLRGNGPSPEKGRNLGSDAKGSSPEGADALRTTSNSVTVVLPQRSLPLIRTLRFNKSGGPMNITPVVFTEGFMVWSTPLASL